MAKYLTFYISSLLVIANGASHQDLLNLHTYDFYDWFLFTFSILTFGFLCLCIGCLWHQYLVRKRESHSSINNLNEKTNANASNNNNNKNEIEVVHKFTKSKLYTIYESDNEYEFQNSLDLA